MYSAGTYILGQCESASLSEAARLAIIVALDTPDSLRSLMNQFGRPETHSTARYWSMAVSTYILGLIAMLRYLSL